jgi:response regulator RpfG family c-di-GMP phosphodiesterase
MINILIVDDEPLISEMMLRMVANYFKRNEFDEYTIDKAANGFEAIGMLQNKKYDMLFLDYMMPKCDGVEVLHNIRVIDKDKFQPYVCMITALGLHRNIELFKENKASSYIFKPFDMKTLNIMLDKYIQPLFTNEQNIDSEEFFDFYDFDEDDSLNEENTFFQDEKDNIEVYNKTHSSTSAEEFLATLETTDYSTNDLDEINELLEEVIEYLDVDSFDKYKNDICSVLSLYSIFLNNLLEFEEFSKSLGQVNTIVSNLDLESIDEKKQFYIIEFIRALLKDVLDWKEHVFVKKDAVDIYYINASIYSNYVQLKSLI